MKTTIPIHGIPVEFSDEKPTRPGAYWYCDTDNAENYHITLAYVGVIGESTKLRPKILGEWREFDWCDGLWSTSPLVPAVEVERAWQEGAEHGDQSRFNYERGGDFQGNAEAFAESRARKIVEGTL